MAIRCLSENPNFTAKYEVDRGPVLHIVHSFSYVICGWIVLINGLLITCFYINRGKKWPAFTTIILCLVIIDFIVGIGYIGINILWEECAIRMWVCATLWGLYVCSQGSALFHMVVICISRHYILSNILVTCNKGLPIRVVYLSSGIIWLVVVVTFMIPFLLWAKDAVIVEKCSLRQMYNKENLMKVQVYLFTMYLIPTLTIVALYYALLIKSRKLGNTIAPLSINTGSGHNRPTQTSTIQQLTKKSEETVGEGPKHGIPVDSNLANQAQQKRQISMALFARSSSPQASCSHQLQYRNKKSHRNSHSDGKQMFPCPAVVQRCASENNLIWRQKLKHIPLSQRLKSIQATKHDTSSVVDNQHLHEIKEGYTNHDSNAVNGTVNAQTIVTKIGNNPLPREPGEITIKSEHWQVKPPVEKCNTKTNPLERHIMRRNRTVVLTIGGVIAFIIICTVPLGVIYGMKAVDPETVFSHTTWLACYTCLLLNSAINPIIYIIQFKVVKTAFSEMMVSACKKVRAMLRL